MTRRELIKAAAVGFAASYVTGRAQGNRSERFVFNVLDSRPRILVSKTQLSAIRAKMRSDPFRQIYARLEGERTDREGSLESLVVVGLVNDSEEVMKRAASTLIALLRRYKPLAETLFAGRGKRTITGIYDFSTMRYLYELVSAYDAIAAFNALSLQEDEEFRAHVFWCMEQFMSEAIRAHNAREISRRHNFHTDNITNLMMAALCFPEHPRAREWFQYALTDFEYQMEHSVWDGAWYETQTYHSHVARTYLRMAYAVRHNSGFDMFVNPGFQALLDGQVRLQTCPDRVYGQWLKDTHRDRNSLYKPAAVSLRLGESDASWDSGSLHYLGMAAAAYKTINPAFAGRLMWGWQRAGGPLGGALDLLYTDPTIPVIPQRLESELLPKIGYGLLRSKYNTPEETYFLFTCGPRKGLSHKHHDLNSFSMFAHQVPLALDAGAPNYSAPDQNTWHRAAVSHNTVIFGGRDQLLEDGKILQYVSKPAADYVVGDASVAAGVKRFHRHVIFVKPHYYVIWDEIQADEESEWILHSPARNIIVNDHSLQCVTPWNVTLDAHFLCPAQKIEVWQGVGKFGREAAPFAEQKYVKIKARPNEAFLTMLHPRLDDDAPAIVRRIGATNFVIEVIVGAQRDYIMLFPEQRRFEDAERGLSFGGRVGVVRTGIINETTILDGTSLT